MGPRIKLFLLPLTLGEAITGCQKCGARIDSRSKKCHVCHDEKWKEATTEQTCCLDGGTCVICGCYFVTELLQAHYCPNCGSKKWDDGKPQSWIRSPDV